MSKKINELLDSSSKLLESYMKEDICPVCAGEGEVDGEICPECSGEGEIDFPGDNGYYGDDYIEEMFIDDPIENVKNYIEGEFNVENVIQYYLDCADEADIHFSDRQIDLIKKHVMDWFGRKNESLNEDTTNFDGDLKIDDEDKYLLYNDKPLGILYADKKVCKLAPGTSNNKELLSKVQDMLQDWKLEESLNEAVEGKNRLIYDACTSTRDRRPTTAEDVEDDVHVYDYNSAEELYDDLLEIVQYDDEEVAEEAESDDLFEKINCLLGWFNDPGDGSPNFLYCIVDGKECDEALPYDCLDDLDLANCSEEDVIEAVKAEFADDDWDYISVEDCIDYCDGNEEAGNILYSWLENEDNLDGDIADKDIEDLVDVATNPHEKEIVARALGYDWAIDDYDEDDE